jgi:transposase
MCTPKVRPTNLTWRGAFLMAKYDVAFKMKVVKEYLEGMNGYQILAEKYNISSKTQIQNWVSQFQQYGVDGLERKQTKTIYTSKYKLDVLHYRKTTGASLLETGKKFGIYPPSSIAAWEKKFREGGLEALSNPKGRPSKTMNKKPKRPYKKKELTREQQLEQEIELLKIENEYLKKLRAFQMNPDSLGKHKP